MNEYENILLFLNENIDAYFSKITHCMLSKKIHFSYADVGGRND